MPNTMAICTARRNPNGIVPIAIDDRKLSRLRKNPRTSTSIIESPSSSIVRTAGRRPVWAGDQRKIAGPRVGVGSLDRPGDQVVVGRQVADRVGAGGVAGEL